jgi:hypothetical protein
MTHEVDGIPLLIFIPLVIVVVIVLLLQGTWLFIDAKKRGANAWFWGIWGCIQTPWPLILYWIIIRRKKRW